MWRQQRGIGKIVRTYQNMAKTCRNFECFPTSLSCLCHKAVAHLPNDHRQTRQGVVVLRMPPPINHHTERNRGAEKKTGVSD